MGMGLGRFATEIRIAAESDALIRLHYRPGHFLAQGHPMATVWPPEVADKISRRLERVHITGPLRTLGQDIAFGIDQLVEIAIRALSPAVNDTFTALTCVDWLGDSLCKIAVQWHPYAYHRSQVLLDQAAMIQRVNLRTVQEEADQADITARYEALLKLHAKGAPAPDGPAR